MGGVCLVGEMSGQEGVWSGGGVSGQRKVSGHRGVSHFSEGVSHFSGGPPFFTLFRGRCPIYRGSPILKKMGDPHLKYENTVNVRSVRILLECTLVPWKFSRFGQIKIFSTFFNRLSIYSCVNKHRINQQSDIFTDE